MSLQRTIRRNILKKNGQLPSKKKERRFNNNYTENARILAKFFQNKYKKVQDSPEIPAN